MWKAKKFTAKAGAGQLRDGAKEGAALNNNVRLDQCLRTWIFCGSSLFIVRLLTLMDKTTSLKSASKCAARIHFHDPQLCETSQPLSASLLQMSNLKRRVDNGGYTGIKTDQFILENNPMHRITVLLIGRVRLPIEA